MAKRNKNNLSQLAAQVHFYTTEPQKTKKGAMKKNGLPLISKEMYGPGPQETEYADIATL